MMMVPSLCRVLFLVSGGLAMLVVGSTGARAQMEVGYMDSERVLERLPAYQTMEQEIDRLTTQWEEEVEVLVQRRDALEREFEARELLYTDDERQRKLEEIGAAEQEISALRRRYFGPDGQLFREQQQRLRPIQQRVLEAVEVVADEKGYDYVFDRDGDFLFLYARPEHDITDRVMEELDIGTGASSPVGGLN